MRHLSSWGMDQLEKKIFDKIFFFEKCKRHKGVAESAKFKDTECFMFGTYEQKTYHKMSNVSTWGMD